MRRDMLTETYSAIRALVRTLPGDDDGDFTQHQRLAFTTIVPLFYIALILGVATVALQFYATAPLALSVAFPVTFCAICFLRAIYITRRSLQWMSKQAVLRYVNVAVVLTGAMALAVGIWCICLLPYGDSASLHYLLYVQATLSVFSVFCFLHIPKAAALAGMTLLSPFSYVFTSNGPELALASLVFFVSVGVTLLLVVQYYFRSFKDLVHAVTALAEERQELKELSFINYELANRDHLTGLANRRRFFSELGRISREPDPLLLAVLDLDNFKIFNDLRGHLVGDVLLRKVALRIEVLAGELGGTAYRVGGDEFAILVEHSAALDIEQRLFDFCRSLDAERFDTEGIQAKITCSIGVAHSAPDLEYESGLYERADYALHVAKRVIPGKVIVFTSQHQADMLIAMEIEDALRNADRAVEFTIVFQPICDRQGRPVYAEALVRWHSPKLGPVSPGVFIPIAERSGLISELNPIFFQKALDAASDWPEGVKLSFNMSAREITDQNAIERLISILQSSGYKRDSLVFELTETAMVQNFASLISNVHTLKKAGISIALDDFGTGFSSLKHLQIMPLDIVKIDKTFVDMLAVGKTSASIVRRMINLCSDMNVECVVEGVETSAQLKILKDMNCNLFQGYYFSRPLTPLAFQTMINAKPPRLMQ